MNEPTVHLYTVCWDEADMLGYFFRHYDAWIDRYVIYDDASTDGSIGILLAHPRVEVRAFARVQADSFVLSHKVMQDEAWKESRGRADWVVVTSIDEHLWTRRRPMRAYLGEQAARHVTVVPALGFDINHPVFPQDDSDRLLVQTITRGRARVGFNKLSIFNPDAVRESGFRPGRHGAEPIGDLLLPARDEVMLWHYKHLGFQRNAAREAAQALRLGSVDRANGFGQQYLWSKERLRSFWDEMERESTDLAAAGFAPEQACAGPLWWNDNPDLRRVGGAPNGLASVQPAGPVVSVLIKSYNHAAYVRRTIDSVISQSYQDFEIVITDDGSTDATVDVLRSFADPRIRLEVHPENRGISAAMNASVARARGRYLAILNSDDWALPGRLERQVAFLDANPEVSLVFGLPQPVDEIGEPTQAFSDFARPLTFPDYTRRTWLRSFFFQGNCLCAPTAMIRREAFAAAGAYDERLTNLQDLDMWVRMLIAGHGIHVLPVALSAFRIRDNMANASAPRPETRLRCWFETTKILKRFAAFDEGLFAEVFGEDAQQCSSGASVAVRVAELARRNPSIGYQSFALDLVYETARTPADVRVLRKLAGSTDVFGSEAIAERDQVISGLVEQAAGLSRHLAETTDALAERDRQIEQMMEKLRHGEREIETLSAQLSAALTARERMDASPDAGSATFGGWFGRAAQFLRAPRS